MTHDAASRRMPRLPVFGWSALGGRREPSTATLLKHSNLRYTTSGRASILLALEALGVGPGDRMLLPTYHCPTMVAPAAALGVVPVFYPIDGQGSADMAWLSTQDLRRVRAILAPHYFGLPQPMAALRQWCDAHRVVLIEDCAHALFGRSGERAIGAWGDMAIGSLTKFLPVPEGGCLVVNNGARAPALAPCSIKRQLKAALDVVEEGALHQRLAGLNALVTRPLAWLRRSRVRPAITTDANTPDGSGIDLGLAHCALSAPSRWVSAHLPLDRIVKRRRHNYERLAKSMTGHAGLQPLFPTLPVDCAPYVFPLWVDNPDPGYSQLRRLRLPVFRWDHPWPGTPILSHDHGLAWSHHVLQVGCHQDLTDEDLAVLAAEVVRLCAGASPAATLTAP